MNPITFVSLLIFVLIGMITPADSTGCYVCKDTDSGCGSPFNYVTSVIQIQSGCTYCTKSYYNLLGTVHISRGCVTDSLLQTQCIDATIAGYGGTQCSCDTNMCNGAITTRIGLATVLSAAIGVVIRLMVVA